MTETDTSKLSDYNSVELQPIHWLMLCLCFLYNPVTVLQVSVLCAVLRCTGQLPVLAVESVVCSRLITVHTATFLYSQLGRSGVARRPVRQLINFLLGAAYSQDGLDCNNVLSCTRLDLALLCGVSCAGLQAQPVHFTRLRQLHCSDTTTLQ